VQELLIICALNKEFYSEKYSGMTYYSGIGKLNAMSSAYRLINKYKPKTIINVGTVGACNYTLDNVVDCGEFYERDNTFDKIDRRIIMDSGKAKCGTGDSFLLLRDIKYDVVDMEAYAIARACRDNNVEFLCYKYVTDYVGKNSREEWNHNLRDSSIYLEKRLDDYFKDAV
jgi:adenosylhomocysteine nucleosidase